MKLDSGTVQPHLLVSAFSFLPSSANASTPSSTPSPPLLLSSYLTLHSPQLHVKYLTLITCLLRMRIRE